MMFFLDWAVIFQPFERFSGPILRFMALSFVFDSQSVRWQWLTTDG